MLSGGRVRDALFAAQMLLARMELLGWRKKQEKGKRHGNKNEFNGSDRERS